MSQPPPGQGPPPPPGPPPGTPPGPPPPWVQQPAGVGQPPGQPAYPAATPPPQPRKKRTGLIIAIVCAAVLAVVVVGAIGFAVVGMITGAAKVGDCLQINQAGTSSTRKACTDAAANYVVLGVTSSSRACVEVAGATATIEAGDKVLCLGAKGADPNAAVNAAAVGDCLRESGDSAEKVECGPGTRKVLEILRNELRAGGGDLSSKCQNVEGAEAVYAWSLESTQRSPVGTYDLIFCLGPQQ